MVEAVSTTPPLRGGTPRRRVPLGTVASLLIVTIALGTLASCSADNGQSVLDPHSPQARRISHLFWLMLGLAIFVYFVVTGLVLVALRKRPPRDGDQRATKRWGLGRDDWFIVIGGVLVPVMILTVVSISTVSSTKALESQPGTVHIQVDAEQFWWRLIYPDDKVVSANEIHVPVGEPVQLTITSDNVIHSVWVPELNGKTDAVPGQINQMSFTAEHAGTYRGQCAEFCGIGHALMAFVVIAEPKADYQSWLRANAVVPATPTDPLLQQGKQLLETTSCAGCHNVAGTKATGTFGPDLTHFALRGSIAAVQLPNDPEHLTRWLAHTQEVKPGALMPQIDLTDAQVQALVAYLESLR
jgi:cytochrome c oxidase subunit 2